MKLSFTAMRQIANNPGLTARSSRICFYVCARNHGIIREKQALMI